LDTERSTKNDQEFNYDENRISEKTGEDSFAESANRDGVELLDGCNKEESIVAFKVIFCLLFLL
jgi:hypothetical protein